MSDYCYQCTEKHLGWNPDLNDLKGCCTKEDNEKGLYACVICEGCGFIQVDCDGKRIGPENIMSDIEIRDAVLNTPT
jgi:hypothetical protein